MEAVILDYPGFSLQQIRAERAADVPAAKKEGYTRVELPSSPDNAAIMAEKGYIFADRTLGVSINLRKSTVDYAGMVRFDIQKGSAEDADILAIARQSFPADRRFHVRPVPDQEIADRIIEDWISKLTDVYVCIHKDRIVGFIDLETCGKRDCCIHLAAVQERYRAAGVAVSLYAHAILEARNRGFERVCGRISSTNTSVMNLYAMLGGVYKDPMDIFVRDEG